MPKSYQLVTAKKNASMIVNTWMRFDSMTVNQFMTAINRVKEKIKPEEVPHANGNLSSIKIATFFVILSVAKNLANDGAYSSAARSFATLRMTVKRPKFVASEVVCID